jgi:hypothetical protein
MSRRQDLLGALVGAQAGGPFAQPPGLEGEPSLGIPGLSGVSRGPTWDAFVSAHAPELSGETITFVVFEDGTIIVDADVPDGSLAPLADAIEKEQPPPYRAAATRASGDAWSVAAEAITVVDLPGIEGDIVDLSVVGGTRELTIDGQSASQRVAALDALLEPYADAALYAERVDGDVFAVDVFPL